MVINGIWGVVYSNMWLRGGAPEQTHPHLVTPRDTLPELGDHVLPPPAARQTRSRACLSILQFFSTFSRPPQGFSSTARCSSDLAKLILIGRLGRDPEVRMTKSEKEYVSYAPLLLLTQVISFQPAVS